MMIKRTLSRDEETPGRIRASAKFTIKIPPLLLTSVVEGGISADIVVFVPGIPRGESTRFSRI